MFIDTNVLVAARFMAALVHVAACRCLDRAGDSEEPMRISRQVVMSAQSEVPNHPRGRPSAPRIEHNPPLPAIAQRHTDESHQLSTKSG